MGDCAQELLAELVRVKKALDADFIGLAVRERGHGTGAATFRWSHLLGAANERSKRMTFRSGQGVGGEAVRVGRPIVMERSQASRVGTMPRAGCPLMLAEQLACAAAAPAATVPDGRQFVLVAGYRERSGVSETELGGLTDGAAKIASLAGSGLEEDPLPYTEAE